MRWAVRRRGEGGTGNVGKGEWANAGRVELGWAGAVRGGWGLGSIRRGRLFDGRVSIRRGGQGQRRRTRIERRLKWATAETSHRAKRARASAPRRRPRHRRRQCARRARRHSGARGRAGARTSSCSAGSRLRTARGVSDRSRRASGKGGQLTVADAEVALEVRLHVEVAREAAAALGVRTDLFGQPARQRPSLE